MLNLNNFKLKTSIKIVAAFLVLMQAVFLLQKVLAGPPSTLTVKALTDTVGFNLTWSFIDNDTSATYFLLKSSTDNLNCPATLGASTVMEGEEISSGQNTTVYDYDWSDVAAVIPGMKYFFKACLYGNGLSGITNSYVLIEETNTVGGIFNDVVSLPMDNISTSTDLVAVPAAIVSDASGTSSIATSTADAEQSIINAKKIILSNVNNELYWQTNGYFASGFYIIWSKEENLVYHSGTSGVTYFSDPLAKFYTIDPYEGSGVYHVRVCEVLAVGECGLSSNVLEINLLADSTITDKTATSTTITASATIEALVVGVISTTTETTITEKYSNNDIDPLVGSEAVEKDIVDNANGTISVGELKNKLVNFLGMISLRDDTVNVKMLKSEITANSQGDGIDQIGSSILMIDSDSDGLPDDIERKIGTDLNNQDTDGDSYDDYAEYRSGYNPLGGGRLLAAEELAPVEMAIVNDETFEQPKAKGELHEDFLVEGVDDIKKIDAIDDAGGHVFSGKATPNTVVTLYVYSDLPLLIAVKTDGYGNWKYELRQSLSDGRHDVYVTLNDAIGKVVAKSSSFSFIVKEAKAEMLIDAADNDGAPVIEDRTDGVFIYYLPISGTLILLGVFAFLRIVKKRKNLNL